MQCKKTPCLLQVLELLGPNLGELLDWMGGKFTLATVVKIGSQVVILLSSPSSIKGGGLSVYAEFLMIFYIRTILLENPIIPGYR